MFRVHHDLGYTVSSTIGGTVHVTLPRYSTPYHRGLRFDEFDCGRVCGPRATPLRQRSWTTWPHGPCMDGAGSRDAIRPIQTVPYPHRKIVSCLFWSIS